MATSSDTLSNASFDENKDSVTVDQLIKLTLIDRLGGSKSGKEEIKKLEKLKKKLKKQKEKLKGQEKELKGQEKELKDQRGKATKIENKYFDLYEEQGKLTGYIKAVETQLDLLKKDQKTFEEFINTMEDEIKDTLDKYSTEREQINSKINDLSTKMMLLESNLTSSILKGNSYLPQSTLQESSIIGNQIQTLNSKMETLNNKLTNTIANKLETFNKSKKKGKKKSKTSNKATEISKEIEEENVAKIIGDIERDYSYIKKTNSYILLIDNIINNQISIKERDYFILMTNLINLLKPFFIKNSKDYLNDISIYSKNKQMIELDINKINFKDYSIYEDINSDTIKSVLSDTVNSDLNSSINSNVSNTSFNTEEDTSLSEEDTSEDTNVSSRATYLSDDTLSLDSPKRKKSKKRKSKKRKSKKKSR